jgi:diguanylate cyclase (GGDEF)-like protein
MTGEPASDMGSEENEGIRRHFDKGARRAAILPLVNAAASEADLGQPFAEELCEILDADVAFVVENGGGRRLPRAIAAVGIEPEVAIAFLDRPESHGGDVEDGHTVMREGDDVLGIGARHAQLAPFSSREGRRALIGVARLRDEPLSESDRALIESVTLAVGHALERIWADDTRERLAARQTALVRAAKSMGRSLEITEVLQTLCDEVHEALGCRSAVAMLDDNQDGFVAVGAAGLTGFQGFRQPYGSGLGGQAVTEGRTLVTHRYQEEGLAPPETTMFDEIRTCIAAPLHWDDRFRAFVSAGFDTPRPIAASDIELMEGFAELAGLACGNSERHAKVRSAARVDGLTGCLNRDALEMRLGQVVDEATAHGHPLSMALLDLDRFKAINDLFGHQRGDAVLRSVGAALLESVRAADIVGRYGGDEFALILRGASEQEARPTIDRIRSAIAALDVPAEHLTACVGLAEHSSGEGPDELVGRADAALREAKLTEGAGSVRRAMRPVPLKDSPPPGKPTAWRRHRWRALAGDIGLGIARNAELASLDDGCAYAASELHEVLELSNCSVLKIGVGGELRAVAAIGDDATTHVRSAGDTSVGEALREKRAILGGQPTGRRERDIQSAESGWSRRGAEFAVPRSRRGAEIAVPLIVNGHLWGALYCVGHPGQLDEVDAELAGLVAEHLSTAIRVNDLFEQLSESLLGTAEALAATMAAKDSYTAGHPRSIAELAVEVGRGLSLPQTALSDLRYAGVFHDIGKIALPDSVLSKRGSLTDAEWNLVKTYPDAGADILAPVPHLDGVRTIVRHAHEHWDGSGYPQGLRGEKIPLGSRIVLATDAYHAMTSDRPYRRARSHEESCVALRDCAGTQFDPQVVETLLSVLERRAAAAGD